MSWQGRRECWERRRVGKKSQAGAKRGFVAREEEVVGERTDTAEMVNSEGEQENALVVESFGGKGNGAFEFGPGASRVGLRNCFWEGRPTREHGRNRGDGDIDRQVVGFDG